MLVLVIDDGRGEEVERKGREGDVNCLVFKVPMADAMEGEVRALYENTRS